MQTLSATNETTVNQNQALWEKGDFTAIAALMRQSGEDLVRSLPISTPMRALDLGCGDGTTAVPMAMLGADVVGIDIASNLVDAGNERATLAGLPWLSFHQGDACDLYGVPGGTFDLVLSMFGAMFAPKPFDVAREMVRVARPGARIVMGNWIPNDATSFVSQLLTISSAFSPPPPDGFISPMTWGVESHVIERFGAAGIAPHQISMIKDTYVFAAPDKNPAEVIDLFRRFYGPTMNAYAAAQRIGAEQQLHDQLVDLAWSQNTSAAGGTSIPATFLRVTVTL